MKDIRPAIRQILLNDPTLNAYVGGTRIYPVLLPQGVTAPSVVQNLITEASDYHTQGPSGLGAARVQIDCWALTADQSVVLGDMVHDELSGFSGIVTWGSNSPPSDLLIRGIFKDQGRDDYDPVSKLYSRRRDFMVWFSES